MFQRLKYLMVDKYSCFYSEKACKSFPFEENLNRNQNPVRFLSATFLGDIQIFHIPVPLAI